MNTEYLNSNTFSTEATSKTDYKFGDVIFSTDVMQTTDTCDEYTSGTDLTITEGFPLVGGGCNEIAFDDQD